MGNAYNSLIYNGSPYTLRKTPVTPVFDEAIQRRKLAINGMLGDPVVHGIAPYYGFREAVAEASLRAESWGYAPSLGHGALRELIKQLFFNGKDVTVFIGAGVSGINDALSRWMFGDPARGGAIIIPRKSYILYFFDAAINNAEIQPVDLTDTGHISLGDLYEKITKDTRMVIITTTGNPIGTSLSEDAVKGILEIISRKEREFGHAVLPVFDVMYEGFRHSGREVDPIAIAEKCARDGPVLVVDSISKRRIGVPGARLGWLAVYWPQNSFTEFRGQFFSEIETIFLPRLGQVSAPLQLGLIKTLSDIRADEAARRKYEQFDKEHIRNAQTRVRNVLTGLVSVPGVILPEWCYAIPGDYGSGIAYGTFDNSFYINFGFVRDQHNGDERIQNPSASRFARFLLENDLPVVGTTPLDCFLPPEDRGRGGDFMRIVALQSDNARKHLLVAVAAYAEHLERIA